MADITCGKACDQNAASSLPGVLPPEAESPVLKTKSVDATFFADGVFNLPQNVVSFSVTARTGTFDISFNNGGSYVNGFTGSRSFGIGNSNVILNSQNIRIRSPDVGSHVDVVWSV